MTPRTVIRPQSRSRYLNGTEYERSPACVSSKRARACLLKSRIVPHLHPRAQLQSRHARSRYRGRTGRQGPFLLASLKLFRPLDMRRLVFISILARTGPCRRRDNIGLFLFPFVLFCSLSRMGKNNFPLSFLSRSFPSPLTRNVPRINDFLPSAIVTPACPRRLSRRAFMHVRQSNRPARAVNA